jgi:hypothetical protein
MAIFKKILHVYSPYPVLKQLTFLIQRETDDKKISILVDEYKTLVVSWSKMNLQGISYPDVEPDQVTSILNHCFDTEEHALNIIERVHSGISFWKTMLLTFRNNQ